MLLRNVGEYLPDYTVSSHKTVICIDTAVRTSNLANIDIRMKTSVFDSKLQYPTLTRWILNRKREALS
jgi:hypothetical protein